jgi:ATP-dependent DNA helicase
VWCWCWCIRFRAERIDRFNNDPSTFLFLISTRAGGLGINLTAANAVIFYDSDWNPQMDLQAQDRCHRIGQTKPVHIYRLATANSIETHILDRAKSKQTLERVVIHKGNFASRQNQILNIDELREILEANVEEAEIGSVKDIDYGSLFEWTDEHLVR